MEYQLERMDIPKQEIYIKVFNHILRNWLRSKSGTKEFELVSVEINLLEKVHLHTINFK
jgi:hypothetical protein